MNKCTETTEGWPDAPDDVSPGAYDAFLTHVTRCPFHANALHAQAENLRSTFRRARGLNAQGRILKGRELRHKLAEQDRLHGLWKEVIQESIPPFRRIYIGNRGEDIVGSGKFFDFRNYEGDHRLDPAAGLQILGVVGEAKPPFEVLLGWYPLEGVKHTGEEQFLPLDNGYTVGLRVRQHSDRNFYIGFRCVETEILEQERVGLFSPLSQGTLVPDQAMLLSWTRGTVQLLGRSLRMILSPRELISFFRFDPTTTTEKLEWCFTWVAIFGLLLTVLCCWDYLPGNVFANGFESKTPAPTDQRTAPEGDRSKRQTAVQRRSPPNKTPTGSGGDTGPMVKVGADAAPSGNKPTVSESKSDPHSEEVNVPAATGQFPSQPPKAGLDFSETDH
jgi:hypothetical protein